MPKREKGARMHFLSLAVIAVLVPLVGSVSAEQQPPKSIDEAIKNSGAYVACFGDVLAYHRQGIRKACSVALQSDDLADTTRAAIYARRATTWNPSEIENEFAILDLTEAILLAADDEFKARYLLDRAYRYSHDIHDGDAAAACRGVEQALAIFPNHKRAKRYHQNFRCD